MRIKLFDKELSIVTTARTWVWLTPILVSLSVFTGASLGKWLVTPSVKPSVVKEYTPLRPTQWWGVPPTSNAEALDRLRDWVNDTDHLHDSFRSRLSELEKQTRVATNCKDKFYTFHTPRENKIVCDTNQTLRVEGSMRIEHSILIYCICNEHLTNTIGFE